MRKGHLLLFVIVVLCGNMLALKSQQVWTLDACIDYALEHNIKISKQKTEIEIQNNYYKQSKNELLPDLSVNGTHYYNTGRSLDYTTYEYVEENLHTDNFSANSSLTIFNGLKQYHTIKKNKIHLQQLLEQNQHLRNEISLNIASFYLNILYQKEIVSSLDSQLDLTQKEIERTKEMIKAGSISSDVLLEIKAQEASEKYDFVKAKNELKMFKLELIHLMNIDTVESFNVVQPNVKSDEITMFNANINEIYKQALKLPRIQKVIYQKELSQKNLDIIKGQKYPSLRFNFSYGSKYSSEARQIDSQTPVETIVGYVNNDPNLPVISQSYQYTYGKIPFEKQIENNLNTSFSLQLNIPIFNKFRTDNEIENAKLKLLNSNKDIKLEKRKLFESIQQDYNDAVAAYKEYIAANKKLISYKKQFNIVKEKYNIGIYNTMEYKRAKNDYAQAQSDMINAKYKYLFKKKILQFYKGEPITQDKK